MEVRTPLPLLRADLGWAASLRQSKSYLQESTDPTLTVNFLSVAAPAYRSLSCIPYVPHRQSRSPPQVCIQSYVFLVSPSPSDPSDADNYQNHPDILHSYHVLHESIGRLSRPFTQPNHLHGR